MHLVRKSFDPTFSQSQKTALCENPVQCTEVCFASFLSGGFTTMSVVNLPDWKLANRTSVQCSTNLWIFKHHWFFFEFQSAIDMENHKIYFALKFKFDLIVTHLQMHIAQCIVYTIIFCKSHQIMLCPTKDNSEMILIFAIF